MHSQLTCLCDLQQLPLLWLVSANWIINPKFDEIVAEEPAQIQTLVDEFHEEAGKKMPIQNQSYLCLDTSVETRVP